MFISKGSTSNNGGVPFLLKKRYWFNGFLLSSQCETMNWVGFVILVIFELILSWVIDYVQTWKICVSALNLFLTGSHPRQYILHVENEVMSGNTFICAQWNWKYVCLKLHTWEIMSQIPTYEAAKILWTYLKVIGFYQHNENLRMHVIWTRLA